MTWSRVWRVTTGVALLCVPVLMVAVRMNISMGWIFAFVFIYGAPLWLGSAAVLVWITLGLFTPGSAVETAAPLPRRLLYGLLWLYLATLSFFCLFMSDGGDADDWQSPAGHFLGVDGYNSSTPEYLRQAEAAAFPSLVVSWAALLAAAITYGVIVARNRRTRARSLSASAR
ncbi:hypothetical protein [Nocardia carnea]|uniref:hypothetical protein n=1 Tax=Nocardia carnea TaxID=37328 RepID=UPI002456516F|nr:hypothetical protein [Nocardia carnea]